MIVQTNMNQMKQQNMGEDFMNIAREYQRKIEDELREICKETIDLVECKNGRHVAHRSRFALAPV